MWKMQETYYLVGVIDAHMAWVRSIFFFREQEIYLINVYVYKMEIERLKETIHEYKINHEKHFFIDIFLFCEDCVLQYY